MARRVEVTRVIVGLRTKVRFDTPAPVACGPTWTTRISCISQPRTSTNQCSSQPCYPERTEHNAQPTAVFVQGVVSPSGHPA